ncbi:LuxR C-terminal-related transcriptional regulator [Shewanella sp. 3B26]|uniref:LuxR C-terminal-related transcriptional regulator n=1 Tax=Shewanella zhuhaiensis TaxID=2919576 RepID=A0AAJ1BEB1_9GAMM|nr:LuxR C-terminal-related transcriptional regulator [Shewanella zhuhaiensis]MCH4293083.1 LuxR C-terminal-related transcriptional regulator [Shewanella zhuhaiensis]
MDIQTRASIHLEGEGFDLLPELKQLYLANGGCLRKALLNTDEQHIDRVVFVDCCQKPPTSNSLSRKPFLAYIAIVDQADLQLEIELLRAGFFGLVLVESPLVLQLSAIDSITRGEMCFSRKALSKFVEEITGGVGVESRNWVGNVDLDLTVKERQVVDYVFQGLGNQQIADKLAISQNTVKMHLQNIYRKNNLKGRVHLLSSF